MASDAPKITDVLVETYEDDNSFVTVSAKWSGVYRDVTGGIVVPAHVAPRLVAAMRAGVVYADPEIRTDEGGETYVSATCRVLGRYAQADLTALGY